MADATRLAPHLRFADKREITAVTSETPVDVLRRSVVASRPGYAIIEPWGEPIALFGTVPDADRSESASIWLLGSDGIQRHSVQFLRHCRGWVEHLQECYPFLWSLVDERNVIHIRWLRWCGFRFLRRHNAYGIEERPFWEVERVCGPSSGDSAAWQGRVI